MNLYRARALRAGIPPGRWDPLDASGSTASIGWRFNDRETPVLYTAEVEALAILEIVVRPGWETVEHVLIARIEVPDGCVVTPADLGIALPRNWNARPATADSRTIAREFFAAIAALPAAKRPFGLRVPSVLSGSDCNVLLDPARTPQLSALICSRIPFRTMRSTSS